jgi:ABC-type proline/glycine betaine transport system ATPase subunit
VQAGTYGEFLRHPAEDYVRDFIRAQRTIAPVEV